jgi:biotin operon repressor
MAKGVKVGEELRGKLDDIRMKYRMSFEQIGRMTGLSHATIRKVIKKKGTAVRDVHRHALNEFVEKVNRGEITFGEDRKAVMTAEVRP